MKRYGLLLTCSCLLACGGVGGSGGEDSANEAVVQLPQLSPMPGKIFESISGRMVASDGSPLASDYEIWLLDQTEGAFARFPLAKDGSFQIPLSILLVEHRYTLHLVRHFEVLGTLDFGELTDGVQGTLLYTGGYGFDNGDIIVTMTRRSEVDRSNPGLLGRLDGGFELKISEPLSFADLPVPIGIKSFAAVSQLIVLDPVLLWSAFYLRNLFPREYADALEQNSRIGVSLQTQREGSVGAVNLVEAPSWLAGSRLAKLDPDSSRVMADLWSSVNFEIPEVDRQTFTASVFTGSLPQPMTLGIFRVQAVTGAIYYVPRLIERIYGQPPKPIAVAVDGTVPDAMQNPIDYRQTDGPNGLLNPVCIADQGIAVVYEPPRDLVDKFVWGSGYTVVDVVLDYYGEGSNGLLQPLSVDAGDFPDGYAAVYSEPAATNPTRSWDPTTRTVRFSWSDEAAMGLTTVPLRLWSQVLLTRAAGVAVKSIRLRTYFRHIAHPGVAASALWLKQCC